MKSTERINMWTIALAICSLPLIWVAYEWFVRPFVKTFWTEFNKSEAL